MILHYTLYYKVNYFFIVFIPIKYIDIFFPILVEILFILDLIREIAAQLCAAIN